ncbi:MAG TPA: serine hydrolase domain-containing protein [Streptomyces sp.]|uniref:serine hydrolase domain-containing protein n=1 Tax=Streptomyces sp. TaxID=1931 RepID=UPI002D6C189C|nr:serine hydrolase domain-containing protein [Streptomyces sp.]HZG05213.1 serine hydrolase domain-containing protein [Streptomyces sp.]
MTHRRWSRRSLVGGALGGALLAAAGGPGARAAARTAGPAPLPPLDTSALRAAVFDLSHPPATSAQLLVDHQGERWYGTAGAAGLRSGRAVRPDDRFRAGSVTKTFVATVVLQLWAARRVDLDAPIGRYLPGLLPPASARITVAHLLNHTSGLPDHRGLPDLSTPEAVLRHRFDRWTPREWVRTVTYDPPKFRPGTVQEYRGVNYVLLALLVEELTGRRYGEAIASRVLRPLGLRRTLLPGGDPRLHGPHVRGYLRMTDGSLRDVTVHDQSGAWGEGELVSTAEDLFRFQQALFSGVLLPPHAMEKLFTTPPDDVRMPDGGPARYSMGLQKVTVNGVTFWGKTGETYGYRTRVFSTRDRRLRFVLSYTPTPLAAEEQMAARIAPLLVPPPPRRDGSGR